MKHYDETIGERKEKKGTIVVQTTEFTSAEGHKYTERTSGGSQSDKSHLLVLGVRTKRKTVPECLVCSQKQFG